jgi:hypothetical protein
VVRDGAIIHLPAAELHAAPNRSSPHSSPASPRVPAVRLEMVAPFDRLNQDRQQRPQPVAAHPVRRLPSRSALLSRHHGIIAARSEDTGGSRPIRQGVGASRSTMQTAHSDELIQDAASLLPVARPMTSSQHKYHFDLRHRADPPHVRLRGPR